MPDSRSPALTTASCTYMPYIPLPPYLGSSAGCIFTILSGKARRMLSEILHRNPANVIKHTSYSASFSRTGVPSINSSRENTKDGTPNLFTRSCTPALYLFDKTTATLTLSLLAKYCMMFSAFVPDPEAKIAIFFMLLVTTMLCGLADNRPKVMAKGACK